MSISIEEILKKIKIQGLTTEDILAVLEKPKISSMGDISIACFKLSGKLRRKPTDIADEIKKLIDVDKAISKVVVAGPYVNIFFNEEEIVKELIKTEGTHINCDIGKKRKICVDYSSVNIAKPFHIGHLSSTVIGAALCRLSDRLGFQSVGINHLGDWGTQFGKLIVAVKKWSSIEEVKEQDEHFVNTLYVKFHKEVETHPELEDQAREEFKKIEEGDKIANEYYQVFKDITMRAVNKVYKRLGIKFDSYNGEAFYNDKMDAVIAELKKKNLLKDSEGAKIVDLEEWGMAPCLIQKADGATLYATRDLAAAIYRGKEYNFYKTFYVVAYQQNLHFKQVFKVLNLMGFEKAKDLEHIAFGMVSLEEGAMSTREGRVVLLEDVLDKATEKASEIIKQKETQLNIKEISEKVGVGAVVFSALWSGRIKDITFSFDKILNFEGETAPYLQYTYARCASILRKAKYQKPGKILGLGDEATHDLINELIRYKDALIKALEEREPSILTRYAMNVASKFSKFYKDNKVLCEDEDIQKTRVAIVNATANILKESMQILGIPTMEEM